MLAKRSILFEYLIETCGTSYFQQQVSKVLVIQVQVALSAVFSTTHGCLKDFIVPKIIRSIRTLLNLSEAP